MTMILTMIMTMIMIMTMVNLYIFLVKNITGGKPNSKDNGIDNISINFNGSLQSWLDDENIIVNAIFPENFRCIISGPSECGKTFLLKNLVMNSIHFGNLYISLVRLVITMMV